MVVWCDNCVGRTSQAGTKRRKAARKGAETQRLRKAKKNLKY